MSGSIITFKSPAYPNYQKVAKTTRHPDSYMANVNTWHPVPPIVCSTTPVSNVHVAKRLIKERIKKSSRTSSDWATDIPNKKVIKSICKSIDNLNICVECKEPNDLLCCDGCPRTFHLKCIGLRDVPDGYWDCEMCDTPISSKLIRMSNEYEITDCDDTDWV